MKSKKLIVLSSLALVSIAGLSSCSLGGDDGDPNTIQVYAWESGLGKVWLDKIAADFNASQDTYKVKLTTSTNASTIAKTLALGTSNPYDLYFTILPSYQYYDDFAILDDVLEFKHAGESKNIGEKIYPGLLAAQKDGNDGKYHMLNYGNTVGGIVYNRGMISEDKIPATTDELADLVVEIAGTGVKPWLFYNEPGGLNGYWNYLSYAWAAQYDGVDYYYNNLMKLTDENGNSPSREVFVKKDGRFEALKVMEEIITPDTTHQQCGNTVFTTVQNLYLQGVAPLTINGSWLLNENKSTADVNMMKTPVISSIVEKLQDKSMSDSTLSDIIREIDGGATSSSKCSDEDFARIKQARNLVYNNSAEQRIFVPKYSNALEGAKEFLKYFFKDSSILTYMNALHLPSNARLDDPSLYDSSSDSVWAKTQFAMAEQEELYFRADSASAYRNHGLNPYAGVQTAQSFLNP
ncbi:MAG TPA: hypothetical protein DEA63_00660, partial [Firmicutes bacterium]|nr:hypothetical protein [Bacillota bacterium]